MAAVERRVARGSNHGTRLSLAIWPRKSLDSSSRVNFTCSGPQARLVLAPRPSPRPRTPACVSRACPTPANRRVQALTVQPSAEGEPSEVYCEARVPALDGG